MITGARVKKPAARKYGDMPLPVAAERLTRERELQLIVEAQQGIEPSREELLSANAAYVIRLAQKRAGLGVEVDDLIQLGLVGLNESIDKYDLASGIRLLTFAWRRINGSMLDSLRHSGRPIDMDASIDGDLWSSDKPEPSYRERFFGYMDSHDAAEFLLSQLSGQERDIVGRFFAGDSCESISKDCGMTFQKVLTTIHRSLAYLRYRFSGQLDDFI